MLYDAAGRTVARYRRAGTFDYVARTAYDLRGNKTLEFHEQQLSEGPNGVAKTFSYDAAHRLAETRSYFTSDALRQGRYDADTMQYINISIGGWISGAEHYSYDGDSRLLTQISKERPGADWWSGLSDFDGEPRDDQHSDLSVLIDDSRVDYSLVDGGPSTYDAAGRATAYRYRGSAIGGNTHTYTTKFEGWETYQEKEVRGRSTDTNYRLTTNTLTYDVMGRLASQQEHTSYNTPIDDRMRYFAYNGDGRVQLRRAGTMSGAQFEQAAATDGSKDNVLFVHAGGQQQAELKEGGTTRTHHGSTVITQQLQSLSGSGNYNAGGGKVTVQPGETLQTLAQRIYGSSQRWYVLADANGMSDPDQVLIEGTQINAPNVNVSSNDAGTFKPYNAGEAIGSTSPNLPYIAPPPNQGCNQIVALLIRVVAIVVAAVVAYYSGPQNGYAAYAAIIGVVGEAAAQKFENNVGLRDGYSWGAIAMAAIPYGGRASSGWRAVGAAMVNAGARYVGAYAIDKALGVDNTHFSLRAMGTSMAQSGAAAGIAQIGNKGASTIQTPNAAGLAPVMADVPFNWGAVAARAVTRQLSNYAIDKAINGSDAHWNLGIALVVIAGDMTMARISQAKQDKIQRGRDRAEVRSGTPSLFDPDYKPDWLYGSDGPGTTGSGSGLGASHYGEGFDTVYPGDPSGIHRDAIAGRYGDVPRSNAINVGVANSLLAGDEDITTLDTVTVKAVRDRYSKSGWYFYGWNRSAQQWVDVQRRPVDPVRWSEPPPQFAFNTGVQHFIGQLQGDLDRSRGFQPTLEQRLGLQQGSPSVLEYDLQTGKRIPQMRAFDADAEPRSMAEWSAAK
ncbi:MAG: LysM peptidoglycan-binding domain-containing protein, partial [Lysobacter sp.]